MSLLSFLFNKENKSANTAKERLQIIIARERTIHNGPDFMPALHQELLAVISKYVQVNPEDIKISLDRQGNLEVLDVNVVLCFIELRTFFLPLSSCNLSRLSVATVFLFTAVACMFG